MSFVNIVNTLMIGKPEKGRMVENMLLRMAQSGQIVNKLGEDELIGLLEQVNSQMQSQERKTTVKVNYLLNYSNNKLYRYST